MSNAYNIDYGAIKVRVEGSQDLSKKIREWNFKSYRNALRRGMSRGAALVRDALKVGDYKKTGEGSPVWSGTLKKAWAVKNSKYTSQNVYSLVGALRRVEGWRVPEAKQEKVKRLIRNKKLNPKPKRQRPTRYLHLVERGHAGRNQKGFVKGRFFMKRTLESLAPEVQFRVLETLREQLSQTPGGTDSLNVD